MKIIGNIFIEMGILLIVIGIIIIVIGKSGIKLGHLPGDIIIKKENFVFYFPITTMLVISAVLNIIFILIRRLK
ncbi:membrane protein [Marinitoga sp. 1135]|uniref:DUF2905 domain-containing protein n=1 Tax=Marinitoga piezophila (strain DSM 14283 / JCM 11233 / KA3) TaxID=443254 RepID=H2J6W4_MARPK|nr:MULTISPECIES: DUF2905 domain-containing protein [Marinitoga]AEX85229.1 Protein of unknown function (DUF2905) [Marinitoga piezophila KA3]APT75719.1 membrane protein [Marinitoga sp. 1137]NUU95457.1 membrane protein [Marinitoga sp. 1135]NUU97385.1 membrane protein [Marinitoga sp. 1138]